MDVSSLEIFKQRLDSHFSGRHEDFCPGRSLDWKTSGDSFNPLPKVVVEICTSHLSLKQCICFYLSSLCDPSQLWSIQLIMSKPWDSAITHLSENKMFKYVTDY